MPFSAACSKISLQRNSILCTRLFDFLSEIIKVITFDIWKNGTTSHNKYVAFRHYNKYLEISEKDAINFLQTEKNGWIVARKVSNPPNNFKNEWDAFRDIIKNKYPFYYQELLNVYNEADGSGDMCNATNMFITSIDQMNEYCDIVFRICKDLRDVIGDTDHSRSDQRYCAFMAERFLSVYINAHGFPKLEADVCRDKGYVKTMSKMVKTLGISNNAIARKAAYRMLRNRNRSSYKK